MDLLKTSTRRSRAGFTLVETVIVLGTLSILASFTLFLDLGNYRGSAFRAEVSTLATTLQAARADALNNVHQSGHGVAIFPADHPRSYVVFQGLTYATRDSSADEVIDQSYATTFSSNSLFEVVFGQLNGDVSNPGTITANDPQRPITSSITINREGAINW